MDKTQYLTELEKALKKRNVAEIAEILSEYETHFRLKREDGFSEEEIVAKLASPTEIAEQFSAAASGSKPAGTAIPVSYTHLDVYKRQSVFRAVLNVNDFFVAQL